MTVVAAGAKAILDLPKTLEVLETLGVPVIACGQDDFPAFWSRSSGLKAPLRMDNAEDIAAAQLLRRQLGLSGGQLVANPIPAEAEIPRSEIDAAHLMRGKLGLSGGQLVANPIPIEAEIARSEIDPFIAVALSEARVQGIAAKAVTPFLLKRIFELTEGRSLTANIALVRNNARLAAAIAIEVARQRRV